MPKASTYDSDEEFRTPVPIRRLEEEPDTPPSIHTPIRSKPLGSTPSPRSCSPITPPESTTVGIQEGGVLRNKVYELGRAARLKEWNRFRGHACEVILSTSLLWPAISFCCLYSVPNTTKKETTGLKVAFGSSTTGQDTNHVAVADIRVPNNQCAVAVDLDYYENLQSHNKKISQQLFGPIKYKNPSKNPISDFKVLAPLKNPYPSFIEPKVKLMHRGDVHRVVCTRKSQFTLAALSDDGVISVWDYSRHVSIPRKLEPCPDVEIKGGKITDSYALAMCPESENLIAAAKAGGGLYVWDISSPRMPLADIRDAHANGTNSLCYHPTNENVLLSAGEDGKCIIWDIRLPKSAQATETMRGLTKDNASIHSVDWCHVGDTHVFAAGCENGLTFVGDTRNLEGPLCTLASNRVHKTVNTVQWNRNVTSMILTSGTEGVAAMWDVSDILRSCPSVSTCTPVNSDFEDYAACMPPNPCGLRFAYCGHSGSVLDARWADCREPLDSHLCMSVFSTSSENEFVVWRPYLTLFKT